MSDKNLVIGSTIEADLTGLGYGGFAVAKGPFGVMFVHRGVPGDRAVLRVDKYKKGYGTGSLVRLVKPSADRVNPKCPGFEQGCGGCQWLHMDYPLQCDWKTRIVRESLKRIGKVSVEVNPVIKMENPYHCRNKLSLQLEVKKGLCGIMRENTHEIVNVGNCRMVLEPAQRAHEVVMNLLAEKVIPDLVTQIHIRAATTGECGFFLYADTMAKSLKAFADRLMKEIPGCKGVGILSWKNYTLAAGVPFIEQEVGGLTYRIPHNGFFQTSYRQSRVLQEQVLRFLSPGRKDAVLDLYCGAGFFALDLARHAAIVTGIESNPDSIRYADKNRELNGGNLPAEFFADDAARGLSKYRRSSFQLAVIDPPRAGCEPNALRELVRIGPKKIAYVSCAPDTLARDLTSLTAAGYRVDYCQPVDMFPHTWHVETITGLTKI
jgi:23S rRNA (uracil1939-C5)-methyltransferase